MSVAPSKAKVILSSKKEMRKLYEDYGFAQRAALCTKVEGVTIVHPFCCTSKAIRYIDPDLDEEILVTAEVVRDHPDGPEKANRRTEITRIVVNNQIYQLKHP